MRLDEEGVKTKVQQTKLFLQLATLAAAAATQRNELDFRELDSVINNDRAEIGW